jgi:membrane fusion protein, multidrug efflux system
VAAFERLVATHVTVRINSFALLAVATISLSAIGCGSAAQQAKAPTAAPMAQLSLSAEDVLTLGRKTLAAGPTITGSILPEKRADLRAEVSAIVIAVLKESGDPVRRGQLLVQLDDTSIRDTLSSAQTAALAASQAFDQAQRQYERLVKLNADGLVSVQQLEDVEVRRNAAQSDREAARSRLVAAQQQQQRTLVRAPFDGIVSDRRVSAGDTAQVGKELLKVIDPASLRFEGFVSADSIGDVQPGQQVSFRVYGFEGKAFTGTITRVNPAANEMTRQVEVLVGFSSGQQQPGVAGLYAEGRVETRQSEGLSVPANVIVRDGDNAFAWRLSGDKLNKVPLRLGERDARSGEFVVQAGVAAGDKLLRYPSSALHEGQSARLAGT